MPLMSDHGPRPLVDSRRRASVSFAPPDPGALGPRRTLPVRGLIAVGPGRDAIAAERDLPEPRGPVSYPIQPGKIQAPGLRDETLARMRLLDWLDTKIHSRVVFVIADAGYGKTTLLADFSRRTRLRTIWYRIDEDDRDWVGFLSHLVAAGREHDPNFAPRTAAMLRALEPGGTTRDDATEAFIAELPTIATDGAALIFDDFHLADEVADVRLIAREIVARAPERLTVVFASRRAPSIPVAKLRTVGELAELGLTDLRFSEAEMEQLFRETYNRPLEPDVLADLAMRTEGWAASLTLVQAALRERGPAEVRAFVRGLSGARDELHDYLAEEVVGDLPLVQQQFLMRTSILQRVTPELAQVASGMTATEVQSLITDAERLGMLGRRASRRSTEQRYHPLVREFLEERLRRDVGPDGIDELHLAVARWAETTDWQTAAHHYAAARQWDALLRVLELHLETILGIGAFAAATAYVAAFPVLPESASVEVLLSRFASGEGDMVGATKHADRALALMPTDDQVIQNLMAIHQLEGDFESARELAIGLIETAKSELVREIAVATKLRLETAREGDIAAAADFIFNLAAKNRASGHLHFEGISLLNHAILLKARGDGAPMQASASGAVEALTSSSSGWELVSARLVKAWALAWNGDLVSAREDLRSLGDIVSGPARHEYLVEHAEVECTFGDRDAAQRLLAELPPGRPGGQVSEGAVLVEAELAIRLGNPERAREVLSTRAAAPIDPGHAARRMALSAVATYLTEPRAALREAERTFRHADAQHAERFRQVASLILATIRGHLGGELLAMPERLLPTMAEATEVIVQGLDQLDSAAMAVVSASAATRPERWRPALRWAVAEPTHPSHLQAARLLDTMGERSDVESLRRVAREPRRSPADRLLGKNLAKRLAPRVHILDLGRVRVKVGDTEVAGGNLRRKVLALLCFLITRPRFTATREEVMDAMWPDIEPSAAVNSLNQSVYFLRRVFEHEYHEDTSAGYLHQDGDVIFLDAQLISAESAACAELISRYHAAADTGVVDALASRYVGRFAADFAYEDWASDYRESLHVGFLHAIEETVRADIAKGRHAHGVDLVRRALVLDPHHESLELSLLKLLKGSGAHSAAAEQYEHYASLLKNDIGIEAPPFDTL